MSRIQIYVVISLNLLIIKEEEGTLRFATRISLALSFARSRGVDVGRGRNWVGLAS